MQADGGSGVLLLRYRSVADVDIALLFVANFFLVVTNRRLQIGRTHIQTMPRWVLRAEVALRKQLQRR